MNTPALMFFINVPPAPEPPAEIFHLGTAQNPSRSAITTDPVSLRLNGQRWMPVMGELHYARVPADHWREELLKLKAGGITVVSTYVFWIHHEETEGFWNWSGDRDLRRFVATAADVGLQVVVRLGPWCHGEVRNGGLPDWIQSMPDARTDSPVYLAKVRLLFATISAQLDGLLWKQGGPIVAFQIENEYGGRAQHLLTLKKIARDAGLDAPLYTRTGWPDLATPIDFGELLPLYGAYPEGFWDRELTPMPGFYPANFRFSPLRTDNAIATDLLGKREAADTPDTARYPFLTCELGGGMMSSYHRRIRIDPRDIEAITLVKLGSGGNLPGYYMYHGGTNPEGLTSLQESQATKYWNDLPEKNYDFQTPVGATGQLRPHYHLLRRLHLFVHDYGSQLAGMPASFPTSRPTSRDDVTTLRWSVRSDGHSGFVFINNYERLRALPAKPGTQLTVQLPAGPVAFPSVTVPADTSLIWPFALDLAPGVRLDHATAQLLCQIDEDKVRTVFFAATPGIPATFAFNGEKPVTFTPGRTLAHIVGNVRIVILSDADSLALYKARWRGRDRVFLTPAGLTIDNDKLQLSSENPADLTVAVFPALEKSPDLFTSLPLTQLSSLNPQLLSPQLLRPPGPAREIPLGWTQPAVAVAPTTPDFIQAAAWTLTLPAEIAASTLLRLRYTGDVIRILHNGRLLTDDFFNGDVLELDATRLAGAKLTIEILPLRPDAPILLPEGTRPAAPTATLTSAELIPLLRTTTP